LSFLDWLRGLFSNPTPPPAPPPPPIVNPGPPDLAAVLAEINARRAAYGLFAYRRDALLDQVAGGRAARMAAAGGITHAGFEGEINHAFPNGSAGEDLAFGYPDAVSLVNAWMSDEGHRANILSPTFTIAGLGEGMTRSGRWIFCVDFDRPQGT
jgi:uncharacterized protein YkwD